MKQKLSQPLLWLLPLILFAFASSSVANAQSNEKTKVKPPQHKSSTAPASKPSTTTQAFSSKYKIGATLLLPNLERTNQELLKNGRKLSPNLFGLVLKGLERSLKGKIPPMFSGKGKGSLLRTWPLLLKNFGIRLDRPLGAIAYYKGGKVYPMLTLGVDINKLKMLTMLLGMRANTSFVFSPNNGSFQNFTLTMQGHKILSGYYNGGQLYIRVQRNQSRLMRVIKFQQPIASKVKTDLFWQWLRTNKSKPLQSTIAAIGSKRWQKALRASKLDLFFSILNLPATRNLDLPPLRSKRIPPAAFIKNFVGAIHAGLSVREGIQVHLGLKTGRFVNQNAQFISMAQANEDWSGIIPAKVAWTGQTQISLKTLYAMIQEAIAGKGSLARFIPSSKRMPARMGSAILSMQARAMGFDLKERLSDLTGQIASGFIWDAEAFPARFKNWLKGKGFQGHLKGVFLILGLKSAVGAKKWMSSLQKVIANLNKNGLLKRRVKITSISLNGQPAFKIQPAKIDSKQPFFLVAHKNTLIFLGHPSTKDAFFRTWKGQAKSFKQFAQSSAQLKKLLSNGKKGSWAFLNTDMVFSLLDKFLPKRSAQRARSALRIGFVSTWRRFQKGEYFEKFHIHPGSIQTSSLTATQKAKKALLSKLGAYRSEAKLNLKALTRGAVSWFGDEHLTNTGDPMAKHFPSVKASASGSVTAPAKTLACQSRLYIGNFNEWNKAPWLSLKFGLLKPHLLRYTYISKGISANASFQIKAHALLDCKGSSITFIQSGKVDVTGEIELSKFSEMLLIKGKKLTKPKALPKLPSARAAHPLTKLERLSKYRREAGENLKKMGDEAIDWFDSEHSNKMGDPIAKHFPSVHGSIKTLAGKITTPKKILPCRVRYYPRNAREWNKSPWKTIKFGLIKRHLLQYTYTSKGTGTAATYQIKAHALLDCRGSSITFIQSGKVNSATGEIERSKITEILTIKGKVKSTRTTFARALAPPILTSPKSVQPFALILSALAIAPSMLLSGSLIGGAGTGTFFAMKRYTDRSKVALTRSLVCRIRQSLDMYKVTKGNYPSNIEGLKILIKNGSLPKRQKLLDPWGNPYQYNFPSTADPSKPSLFSFGSDGRKGGRGIGSDIYCVLPKR